MNPEQNNQAGDSKSSQPAPTQSTFDQTKSAGPAKNTLMAVLSYIGPLVIVSYLTAKDDAFVKFHAKQGFVLLAIEVAVWILSTIWWVFWPIFSLINLATLILSIVGIVHAAQGKEKELPIVGKWSKSVPI